MAGEHNNSDDDAGGEASKPKYAARRQAAIGSALKAVAALYAGRTDLQARVERMRARARIMGGVFTLAELNEITAEAEDVQGPHR